MVPVGKTNISKKVHLVLESILLLPIFTGDRKNECIQKIHLVLKNHYFYLALLDSGDRKDERVQKGTHGVGKPKLLVPL